MFCSVNVFSQVLDAQSITNPGFVDSAGRLRPWDIERRTQETASRRCTITRWGHPSFGVGIFPHSSAFSTELPRSWSNLKTAWSANTQSADSAAMRMGRIIYLRRRPTACYRRQFVKSGVNTVRGMTVGTGQLLGIESHSPIWRLSEIGRAHV